jgi:hypothetical protein
MDDDHRDEKMVASAKNEEEVIDRSLELLRRRAGRTSTSSPTRALIGQCVTPLAG